MNRHIKYLILVCTLLLSYRSAFAQSAGSTNTENSTRYIGGTRTSLAETMYIGPDANITVDGTWRIYSKYVWISPLAQVSGSGNIVFHNSDEVGGSGGATVVDGNNNLFIDANIVHANNTGMQIKNVTLAPDLAALGWTNNASFSTLKIGKDFNLSVNGADVWLDESAGVTGDFVFDDDATISNFRPERMVITNNTIQSHMVKQAASSGFIFPVGIADGDYTPAQVTGSGTYHVSVQNYASSTSDETLLNGGPERTWNLYSDVAGSATVALQHNVSTDTPLFDSADPHYVTQYSGTSWSAGTEESGLAATFTTGSSPIGTASTQDLTGVAIPTAATDPTSYLTKANKKTSLPVTLISFTVKSEGVTASLIWTTSEESNADRFEVERSDDAKNWVCIGEKAAIGESKSIVHYKFHDKSPTSGTNYYRLKMVDRDQTYTYSRIQGVSFRQGDIKILVYPNPVTDIIYLKDAVGKNIPLGKLKEISFIDTKGITVLHSVSIGRVLSGGIDVTHLPIGFYLVKVTLSDGKTNVYKVLKQ